MKANINNITYIEYQGRYHIVVEFSRMPIETMGSEQDAIDFIEGYLNGKVENEYNSKGKMLREFVELDLRSGVEYGKVFDFVQLSA